MGIDLLDFSFRIEKSFGIKIDRDDYSYLPQKNKDEITAGELHFWVVQICIRKNLPVPWSSWHRVKLELAKVTGQSPRMIFRGTLIVGDLGFS